MSGLSTALTLLRNGFKVKIISDKLPHETTSQVAAAVWYPYKAEPVDKMLAWGKRTFDVLWELSDDPTYGISRVKGMEYFRYLRRDPWWQTCVKKFTRLDRKTLPHHFLDGFSFEVPVIEMPIYLEKLKNVFLELGGEFSFRHLNSLDELSKESPVIFNCTGLGAKSLLKDADMFPIRGQVVWVAPPPLKDFLFDGENKEGDTYIIPRSKDCVLGGSAEKNNDSLTEDTELTESILRRCNELNAKVQNSKVIAVHVGLRPGRKSVRVEREDLKNGQVLIHNYGHGGSGVTLSWGCAEAAAQFLSADSTNR